MAQEKPRTGAAPSPASKPAGPADNRVPETPDGTPDSKGAEEHAGASGAGEIGGPAGPEPTRYGDWEVGGRCTDF